MKPYYRLHNIIRILQLYVDGANEAQKIHIDPRIEYPLNVDFTMPNETVKVTIKDERASDGKLVGLLVGSRAIEIANFSTLFNGQFNDDAIHSYITKRNVEWISLFCPKSGLWDRIPVARTKVKIVERTDKAFRLEIGDRTGWSRSFADIELTEFGRCFDGRFNCS